jgi:4-hydroxy-4-methyl-2-oxoglutarate aldolase
MTTPIDALLEFDTCTLSDALDRLQLPGAVGGITPVSVVSRIVGRAVTMKLGMRICGSEPNPMGIGALSAAHPGDVVVVEHGGRLDVSGWGGFLSRAAARVGVRAIVIDGACRDVHEMRAIGLPVFARAAVPVSARGRVVEHHFDREIVCGGVTVHPGDIVLADENGVVFVQPERLAEALRVAKQLQQRETVALQGLEAGLPLETVFARAFAPLEDL